MERYYTISLHVISTTVLKTEPLQSNLKLLGNVKNAIIKVIIGKQIFSEIFLSSIKDIKSTFN